MKRIIGNICIVVGAVFLLGATGLLVHNMNEDANAADAAHDVMTVLVQEIEKRERETSDLPTTESEVIERKQSEQEEQTLTVDGNVYMGYLDIPALKLTLPVMSNWSYEGLKIAPCRYSGTVRDGNLVICAHNYASHFGRLSALKSGDEIYFVDINGKVKKYTVAEPEELKPAKIEDMISSDFELTLFTCTYTGMTRYAVRCIDTSY